MSPNNIAKNRRPNSMAGGVNTGAGATPVLVWLKPPQTSPRSLRSRSGRSRPCVDHLEYKSASALTSETTSKSL